MSGPDEIGDRIRVEEFRRQGVAIGEEFRAWHATVFPQDGGERTLARDTLHALLDDVDAILAGGDPRADRTLHSLLDDASRRRTPAKDARRPWAARPLPPGRAQSRDLPPRNKRGPC